MGGLVITWPVMSLNDTFPCVPHHHNSLKHGRLPVWQVWCQASDDYLLITSCTTLMPGCRWKDLLSFFKLPLQLFNHPFLPRCLRKTQKEEYVCREPTWESSRCQGWEVEGPSSVGGSDGALLAVNEGWTDTLITPCNLQGANRWIFPLTREITCRAWSWTMEICHVMSPL